MYRVFDKRKNRWVRDDIFLTQSGMLCKIKRGIFGRSKIVLLYDDEYIYHNAIELTDREGRAIFEGDIVKAYINGDDEKVLPIIAEIAYIYQLASYVLLDYATGYYYSLGEEQCNFVEVIGNVLDNPELLGVNEDEESVTEREKTDD